MLHETFASLFRGARTPEDGGGAAAFAPEQVGQLDPGLEAVLASKLLYSWLRNRHQLLFPFALNLRQLERGEAELMLNAMVAAAQADGAFEARERDRLTAAISLLGLGDSLAGVAGGVFDRPKPLFDWLAEVRDVRRAALVYAASLIAIDRRKPVNRHFLRYLAARLGLSDELVESLEQRFSPSR